MSWYLRWTNRESPFWSKEWRLATPLTALLNLTARFQIALVVPWSEHSMVILMYRRLFFKRIVALKMQSTVEKSLKKAKKNGQTYHALGLTELML